MDVGYLFTAAPAKHSYCSLPWMWGSSSQPPPLTLDVGMDLTETEDIKKRWQEYTEKLYKKIFMTQIIMMV